VVARLTAQKRVDLAIRAMTGIPDDVRLTIIGDGPDRASLEALARSLGVAERVRFAGRQPPDLVPEHLARADLMVYPARAEGFGLVAAAALMAGVPVVACEDGGGVRDIISDDRAGRLVPPEAAVLASAVRDLLADSGRREGAREHGARWRQVLAPERAAARFESYYHAAIAT
jgi:glycosyltransferase involved in cell wall biosynthesis